MLKLIVGVALLPVTLTVFLLAPNDYSKWPKNYRLR